MTANKFEKHQLLKAIWLAIWLISSLLWGVTPAQAQTATPFVTTVTVTVLDENGDPVAFLPIELHMFEYTASIEAIAVGGCGTDESGTCAIEAVNPPSLGSWMEGMIYIPGLGMEYIGWSEPVKLVVIQLLPGNVLPTPESFLHFPIEGQDEIGTDVPLEMAAALTLAATLTLAPTATETQTPLPPTGTATQTPENTPTETTAPTATPTATPTVVSIFGGAGRGTNYLLLLALVGAVVAATVYVFISRRSRPKPKKSNLQDEKHHDA